MKMKLMAGVRAWAGAQAVPGWGWVVNRRTTSFMQVPEGANLRVFFGRKKFSDPYLPTLHLLLREKHRETQNKYLLRMPEDFEETEILKN